MDGAIQQRAFYMAAQDIFDISVCGKAIKPPMNTDERG
jgi:hypothetical protein